MITEYLKKHEVQKNWLSPLVDLMNNDPKIGAVGAKLFFPDKPRSALVNLPSM